MIWHEETQYVFLLSCRGDKVHIVGSTVVSENIENIFKVFIGL